MKYLSLIILLFLSIAAYGQEYTVNPFSPLKVSGGKMPAGIKACTDAETPTEGQVVTYNNTLACAEWDTIPGLEAALTVGLDIGGDGDDSIALTKIFVLGDANGVFAELNNDELTIDLSNPVPLADTAASVEAENNVAALRQKDVGGTLRNLISLDDQDEYNVGTAGFPINILGDLDADQIQFADPDNVYPTDTVGAVIAALRGANESGPNSTTGKVHWEQIIGMPEDFADGQDAGAGTGTSVEVDLGSNGTDSTGMTKLSTIGDVNNVLIEDPENDNQFIIDFGNNWPEADALAGFSGVAETSPQDDDVLVYDTGEWVNKASAPLADVAITANSALGIRNAADFAGADIGAKINAAIDDFPTNQQGIIVVPPESWGGASFSTQIVLDKPVTIKFPGVGTLANYTGTEAAFKVTADNTHLIGLALGMSGNANPDVDAYYIAPSGAPVTDCRITDFRFLSPVRHGINSDAGNDGAYNCTFTNGRITTPGGDQIHIDSTGTALSNSFEYENIVLNGTPASFNGIRIADGYDHSFENIYIQACNATAWSFYNSGDFQYVSNLIIDSDCEQGIKNDAGNLWFGGIQNNANTTKYSVTGGNLFFEDFSGTAVQKSFNAYNAFTDLNNYELGSMSWNANILEIGTSKAGTGTARSMYFKTNGALRWGVNSNGHLVPATDDLYTIGGASARPSVIYGHDVDVDYIEYNETDTPNACSTGNYGTYADASEAKIKVCNNGIAEPVLTASQLDINADQVAFDDPDSNYSATNVEAAIAELDDVNGSGPNATDAKVDWSQLGNVPAFRKTLFQLRPQANEPPASSFATFNTRNSHPALRFNGNVCAIWSFVLPNWYGGNGVTAEIWYVSTETSNDTDWDGSWERIETSQDIDSDSFATAVSADNNNNSATSGIPTKVSIAFTSGAQMDNCAAGELCRFRLCRDDTSDTGGADTIDFIGGQIKETP